MPTFTFVPTDGNYAWVINNNISCDTMHTITTTYCSAHCSPQLCHTVASNKA